MPEGSSSAQPVIKPGSRSLKNWSTRLPIGSLGSFSPSADTAGSGDFWDDLLCSRKPPETPSPLSLALSSIARLLWPEILAAPLLIENPFSPVARSALRNQHDATQHKHSADNGPVEDVISFFSSSSCVHRFDVKNLLARLKSGRAPSNDPAP